MWVDAERGELLLTGSEVSGWARGLAEQLLESPQLQGRLRTEVLAGLVGEAIAGELELVRGGEPAVLLAASEPNALQLVALLRSHRRDRGADPSPLDAVARAFKAWS